MAGRRGSECRVLGCKRPAVFQLYMPGGDVIEWWWQAPDGELHGWELWVCAEHGALLADEIADGWGCIEPGQAEGWRLVVQFVASPDATNPLALYPPGTCEQPQEVLAPVQMHVQPASDQGDTRVATAYAEGLARGRRGG